MRFTSVPKKLLLTGMSAAMAAAFAPAVAAPAAQAKTGDASPVVVEDASGATVESFGTATSGQTITLPASNKLGYEISGFTRADGTALTDADGKTAGFQYKVGDLAAGTAQTVVKAVSAQPEVKGLTLAQDGKDYADVTDTRTGKDVAVSVALDNSNLIAGRTYTLKVTDPSGQTFTRTYAPKADTSGSTEKSTAEVPATATVTYQANPASNADANEVAKLSSLKEGTFTVELSDGQGTVSSKSFDLAKATVTTAGTGAQTRSFVYRTGKGIETKLLATEYASKNFVDAKGLPATDADLAKATGAVELTESTATQSVASATYSADRHVAIRVTDSGDTTGATYQVTVTDPAGKQVYQGQKGLGTFEFSFDRTSTAYNYAGEGEAAGAYTIQVVKTDASGAKTTVKDDKDLVLTEVKTKAGTGAKLAKGAKDLDVFYQKSYSLPKVGAVYEAADGYTSSTLAWQLDGKALSSANAPKPGAVNEVEAVASADTATYLPTPTLVSSAKDAKAEGSYDIKVADSDANAQLQYSSDGGTTWNNVTDGTIVTNEKAVLVRAAAVAGKTAAGAKDSKSLALAFNDASAAWSGTVQGAGSALEGLVGLSNGKWRDLGSTAKAITAGTSAIDGLGFYYADSDAADATVLAQYKALYEAVAADAAAQVAPYASNAPVVVNGKVYTLGTADYAAAQKALADQKAAVDKAVGATGATQDAKVAAYKGAVGSIVSDVNEQLNKAAESIEYTAADVTSAQAAKGALEKAASDYADVTAENAADAQKAAEDAIAQYDTLSAKAKELVGSEVLSKAQAVRTAAQKATGDAAAAQKVSELVEAIPASNADLAAKQTAIDRATGAYEALSADQKELVTGYASVAKAQKSVTSAKKAQAKKVSGVKVKAGKAKATVSWKEAKGYKYQVYYKASGKKAARAKAKSAKATLKKLASGKKYTFKVRTYKKVGDTTFYGKWSKKVVKKIK